MSGDAALAPRDHVLIVGASLAGLKATEALRYLGFTGPITLLGDERHVPYDRPPLSKQLLSGEWTPERIGLIADIASLDADLRLGQAAIALDTADRVVKTAEGENISFDALVIATGARARTLPPGSAISTRVHTLRTMDDSLRLAASLRGRVLIVGAGFIGSEVASTAATRGCQVTVVEPQPGPMHQALGARVSDWLAERMRAAGIDLHLGVGVAELAYAASDGPVTVSLTDGSSIVADCVVVGIGAIPNTDWLQGSTLRVDNGVLCDQFLFAADGIAACGDVARWHSPLLGRSLRVEHWTNAVKQGELVAHNLINERSNAAAFSDLPYVWSDQFGLRIEVIGFPDGTHADEILWGDRGAGQFLVAYRSAGILAGLVGVNATKPLLKIRRRLAEHPALDHDLIMDAVQ